jgi:hypothetical protein
MTDRLKDIPELNRDNSNLSAVIASVRETLQTFRGYRGNPLDTALTLRTARAVGLLNADGTPSGGATGPGGPAVPPGGERGPDLTPPPTPTGLAVTPGVSYLYVECDQPVYLQGGRHNLTVVYGVTWTAPAPEPTFSNAVELFRFPGTIGAYPTNPGMRWKIWIKWLSNDGVESVSPAGGTNGVEATTAPDVPFLLQTLAGQITATELSVSLSATLDANAAAIQTESMTRATQTGELYAQFTVKTDVAGLVSGYGLASTSNNAAPTSAFGIQAGQFFVAPPAIVQAVAPTVNRYRGMVWLDTSVNPAVRRFWSGTIWSTTPQALPFVVQVVPETINGEVVSPGIYAENAFFARLVATRGQIGTAVIDDAKIANVSAGKITTGSIAVGQFIQATGYIPGSAGWRINGDGTAEFSQVVVRGTVFATAGQIGGITIAANAVRAGQTAFNTGSGFFLGSNGTFSLGNSAGNQLTWDGFNLNISGALNAATGTFAGSLSAATGTFAGNVSGGQFTTGGFTGYVWPASGQIGSYLGPNGLLLGNFNNGQYFQVEANGNIYAPGFQVVAGLITMTNPTINGVTLNAYSASVAGGSLIVSVGFGTPQTYGSRTVTASGGNSPYTYQWAIVAAGPNARLYLTDANTQTVTVIGTGDGLTNAGTIVCFIRDVNGRISMASFFAQGTHAASGG